MIRIVFHDNGDVSADGQIIGRYRHSGDHHWQYEDPQRLITADSRRALHLHVSASLNGPPLDP